MVVTPVQFVLRPTPTRGARAAQAVGVGPKRTGVARHGRLPPHASWLLSSSTFGWPPAQTQAGAVRQQLDACLKRGRPPASAKLFGAVRRAPRTAAARFTPWFTPQGPTKENGLAPCSANPLIFLAVEAGVCEPVSVENKDFFETLDSMAPKKSENLSIYKHLALQALAFYSENNRDFQEANRETWRLSRDSQRLTSRRATYVDTAVQNAEVPDVMSNAFLLRTGQSLQI